MVSKSFGQLSTASKETQKQIARFLKEGILEKAPIVGDANKRVKSLIELERFLDRASSRFTSKNLIGPVTRVAGALGGVKSAAVSELLRLVDSPTLKSAGGIAVNELSKLVEKGSRAGKIPLVALVNLIADFLNKQDSQE